MLRTPIRLRPARLSSRSALSHVVGRLRHFFPGVDVLAELCNLRAGESASAERQVQRFSASTAFRMTLTPLSGSPACLPSFLARKARNTPTVPAYFGISFLASGIERPRIVRSKRTWLHDDGRNAKRARPPGPASWKRLRLQTSSHCIYLGANVTWRSAGSPPMTCRPGYRPCARRAPGRRSVGHGWQSRRPHRSPWRPEDRRR